MKKWVKKGFIYNVSGQNGFDFSHCHKPTPLIIDDKTVRVYFGVRDELGKTRTTFIDLDINNLKNVLYIHNKPVLDLGKIGTFDDSGANVSSIVRYKDKVYMYHIGWNPSTTVHTRNSIGISVSTDNGWTFNRLYDGSILDRTKDEPYYTGAVDVKCENGLWRCWYTSGSEWKIINNRPEIFYHIKYAESNNGIDWERNNIDCILPKDEFEATARPSVLKLKEKYIMFYSRRSLVDFRMNPKNSYRIGYAESEDGIKWKRMDDRIQFGPSGGNDFDSNEIAYPYVIQIKDKLVMFYNGNDFGKTGFGYAIFE